MSENSNKVSTVCDYAYRKTEKLIAFLFCFIRRTVQCGRDYKVISHLKIALYEGFGRREQNIKIKNNSANTSLIEYILFGF